MEIVFCQKKDGKLVHDQQGWNPEHEIAVYEVSNVFNPIFKLGCTQIYNKVTSYKILTTENNDDVYNYISSLNGKITSIDNDFDKVMRDEQLENALGITQIIRINFTTTIATDGKNCEPCVC